MARSLTLRKPGVAPLVDVDSFVTAGEDGAEPHAAARPSPAPVRATAPKQARRSTTTRAPAREEFPSFKKARKAVVELKTKSPRRRTTVYLELEVARRLATYCETADTQMSTAINEAVVAFLDRS